MSNLLAESSGLVAFVRSVESGSFSAAARDLDTTPSAVSRSISRLEGKLGVRLFLRSTRALRLTPDGQAFFERIAPLLKDLDSADEVLATGLSGRLKISLPNELARVLTAPILEKLAKPNPALELEIGMSDRHADIIRENYDVVFRVGHLRSSELTARKLAGMPMVIVASPEFLSRHGEPHSADHLASLPFARYVANASPFEITFADGTSISPTGQAGFDSSFGLHEAARLGMGAAYLMECVVAEDMRSGRLVRLMPDLPLPSQPLHAVHAFGRNVPKKVSALCDLVSIEIGSLAGSGELSGPHGKA